MGAKPIVATAPIAWLLLVAVVPPRGPRREPIRWRRATLLLAPVVVMGVLLVRGALRSVAGRADAGFSVPGMTPWTYFLTQWRAVATYVRLLAWPAGQSADWSFPWSKGIGDPGVSVAGAFLASLLVGAALLWRRSRSGTDPAAADGRAAAYGVAWFFLVLAPTSSFLPIADVLVEHRVYLASWGLFLAAVLAGDRLIARAIPARRAWAATIVVGAAWAVLAVALHRRNAVWEEDLAFWRDVVEKAPGKARPRLGLGTAMLQRGDLQGAAEQFAAGIRRAVPEATGLRVSLLQNLGAALVRQGRSKEALVPLQEAVALDPSAIPPAETRALALWLTGDVGEAERQARSVLARAPDSELCSLVMGQVLMARGDDAGAIPYLEKAVRARPTDAVLRYDLGAAYANGARIPDACAAWKAVLALPAAGGAQQEARQGRSILGCPP
jgi:tetratricopeptide (TPR) repeat protein